jgi:hypothetical protein
MMKRSYVLALFFAVALIGGSPRLLAADNVKVPLVLFDNTGSCINETMADYAAVNPALVGGFVNVHRNDDGSLLIVVHLKNGTPDTVYEFNIKCLGTFENRLVTNSQGVGNAIFTLPPEGFPSGTGAIPSVFAFDMFPHDIPADNIYQSAQVDLGQ